MGCWVWSSAVLVLFGVLVAYRQSTFKHQFVKFSVPPAHQLDKSIPTHVIKDYELLLHGQINGIESLEIVNDIIYATDQNCDVMKIENGKITQRFPLIKNRKCENCCSALGIRHWYEQKFVFVDGVLGVLVLNFADETIEHVYPATNLLGKHVGMFADDFDFIDKETIIFSDLASSCPLSELFICFYGGVADSREDNKLIQLNLRTRKASVLIDDQLAFNGVQLHTDKESVLVAQSLLSRVMRYYFEGAKKGQLEVFIDGLPGLPDNIRLSSKGNNFWITHFLSRNPGSRIIAQTLGPYPWLKQWLLSVTQIVNHHLFDTILTIGATSHHIFLEVDSNGKIVSAIHDPNGNLPFITQLTDGGSHLYFSSIGHDYVGKVKKFN